MMKTFYVNDKTPEKCCCTCAHNIRKGELSHKTCYCEIDNHYIGYVACFERLCRRWKKAKDEGSN